MACKRLAHVAEFGNGGRILGFPGLLPFAKLHNANICNNDQELIQSDPIYCPQNQKGNN